MTVGVLGGGQLGRMLALAGIPLGLTFRFLDRAADAVAGAVGPLFAGELSDETLLARFLDGLDVVTYEFENVPLEIARHVEGQVPLFPSSAALAASQDRLVEKQLFRRLGAPTAEFAAVDSPAELRAALEHIGVPALLKTRRLGYDGKGQFLIREPSDADRAWEALAGVPLILEGFVRFKRELSLIAVRGRDRATAFYPLVENEHRDGILFQTIAPAPGVSRELEALARGKAHRLLDELDYVGALAIEFFEVEGRLFASEFAPRVHNSGHWTLDAAATSQFENHLRAILGWPLGPADATRFAIMLNLIGRAPPTAELLRHPTARLHLYGKTPRPGRKLGHVTFVGADAAELSALVAPLRERL